MDRVNINHLRDTQLLHNSRRWFYMGLIFLLLQPGLRLNVSELFTQQSFIQFTDTGLGD